MKQYVALDVSQKETSVCVVNEEGEVFVRRRPSPIRECSRRCFAREHRKRRASVSRPER
jgi:hypothetical protein